MRYIVDMYVESVKGDTVSMNHVENIRLSRVSIAEKSFDDTYDLSDATIPVPR